MCSTARSRRGPRQIVSHVVRIARATLRALRAAMRNAVWLTGAAILALFLVFS
jgi:hypothetical protein